MSANKPAVPKGDFAAKGNQTIPAEYISKIPAIAFSVPDIDATAQLSLKAKDGSEAACITSTVTNGKTVEVPAVSYVAAAIAAGSLAASLVSAGLSAAHPGATSSSPGFVEVMWWFQGLAMNGMHSVNYPSVYRSFTKNFAFSTGLVPWGTMQTTIDNFRKSTGGNLTDDSYQALQNVTLQFADGSTAQTSSSIAKRAILFTRDITTSINGTGTASSTSSSTQNQLVNGIQAYVEQLTIPQANTFMTVLLVFSIVVAAIVVGILLFKVILETWALWGRFPRGLATFRKEYWRVMAQTIVSLVMLLYGVWTLYCIFQFTHGDSWAAKILAGVTLGVFTAVLLFYSWKIWFVAHKLKQMQGNTSALYDDKPTWKKYRIFYENYKKQYWWLFLPFIVYMFAKGCILGAADGHGLVQTGGQLIVESLMLILLLWNRPYDRKSGNWINIVIQVVRVLSVACILVFTEELGIAKTTTTITGVVLIVVQSTLTGVLALLILINAIISCCKVNPHRKRRKAALKNQSQDLEGDAFLMQSTAKHQKGFSESSTDYDDMRAKARGGLSPRRGDDSELLMSDAASMGKVSGKGGYTPLGHNQESFDLGTRRVQREPTLPNIAFERFRPS
jgi:hypothetical protein